MSAKKLPPPTAGADLRSVLRSRHHSNPDQDDAASPATATATPLAADPSKAANGTAMVRRSWYLPAVAADALRAVVDDLHHETRRPKHEVLAALLATAVDHLEDARQRLN